MDNNNNNKQRLLLEYLISSPDTFALCKGIVKSDYFDPEYRKTVDFLHTYYDKYSATPDPDQVVAETGVKLKRQEITHDKLKYCADEIEHFCQRGALVRAVIKSGKLIEDNNYGEVERIIRDAITVSLNKDLGLDYFSDPMKRLTDAAVEADRTPIKWDEFDDLLGGGLARGEMLMFSANSGGGKSIAMANVGINMLAQGLNVLYISLELSEVLIAQRYDMMFTGVPSVVWKENMREIAYTIDALSGKMGKLTIKRMPVGTNSNQIRAYLKEYELKNGFVPDVLIVDYLDIMGPNEKVAAENVFEKDKRSAEQLRDIGEDFNMFIITASQQNRSAVDAQELNHSHIAGGISKINTVDWSVSIILSPTMKAAGEIGFCFLKTRSSDGVGKTIYMKWENSSLRIKNLAKPKEPDDDVITHRISQSKSGKRSMDDLFKMTE